MPLHHAEVLRYLLTHGVPADVPDIVGYSALHHCAASPQERPKLARVLLENGAAVNLQNRYGETPLFGAFQINLVETIDVLMEFGADLDIPEADNLTARQHFLRCGPQVTAVVTKWIRKRNGEEAPRDGKRCDHCGKTDVALKVCTRCKVARYCNPDCQSTFSLLHLRWICLSTAIPCHSSSSQYPERHWPTHKKGCQPFNVSTTVTLKPYYQSFGHTLPTAAFARNIFGYTSDLGPEKNTRAAHVPPNMHPGSSKSIIIKVQVPFGGDVPLTPAQSIGELLIYTKKRDFVCQIRRMDRPADYDRIASVVRTKGVGGAKAYFAAELMSKDELVVKVSEVLAEQPF